MTAFLLCLQINIIIWAYDQAFHQNKKQLMMLEELASYIQSLS